MPSARIIALLAIFVQSACGSPRPSVTAATPRKCLAPPKTGKETESKLDDGKPALPDGIACLAWPMGDFRTVTSTFRDPHHPFVPGRHNATDIQAPVGTSVLAPAAGVVVWTREVADCQDAGVAVLFGEEDWVYEVHHLSRVDVVKGEKVVFGERLGLSGGAIDAPGSGPWTTGPHLHFSTSHAGAYVDSARYLCP